MKFQANINVLPKPEILDPQGKAVQKNLHKIGFGHLDNVRIGKRIQLTVEAATADEAKIQAEKACDKLLANVIMESYEVEILPSD